MVADANVRKSNNTHQACNGFSLKFPELMQLIWDIMQFFSKLKNMASKIVHRTKMEDREF